jgi:high affinity Mn2+ porin
MKKILWLFVGMVLSEHLLAQPLLDTSDNWSVHFQLTVINQRHTAFKALYSGANSLADSVEPPATSVTSTLFFGRKLWKGAAFYLDPELSGGAGLSYALGVAGALNGETYRLGTTAPVVTIARGYLQQVFTLKGGGDSAATVDDGPNQVACKLPANRITLTAGKFAISDYYDNNSYSHDPRSQFLNWGLMSNGAWDYPANTRGYTWGFVAELIKPDWRLRVSSVYVPVVANHSDLEYVFNKANSETVEYEQHWKLGKHGGIARLLYSYTADRAPSYQAGLAALKDGDTTLLKVISGNAESYTYGGNKTGLGLNLEQELTDDIGVFARVGFNDGRHVTWAFTEIDRTLTGGLSIKGAGWKRADDVVGVAGEVNGLSSDHRAFLKAGGYGFIIGDGHLNYGHEAIGELYYACKLYTFVWITADYQIVKNPGYNKDRAGPVNVFAFRCHVQF